MINTCVKIFFLSFISFQLAATQESFFSSDSLPWGSFLGSNQSSSVLDSPYYLTSSAARSERPRMLKLSLGGMPQVLNMAQMPSIAHLSSIAKNPSLAIHHPSQPHHSGSHHHPTTSTTTTTTRSTTTTTTTTSTTTKTTTTTAYPIYKSKRMQIEEALLKIEIALGNLIKLLDSDLISIDANLKILIQAKISLIERLYIQILIDIRAKIASSEDFIDDQIAIAIDIIAKIVIDIEIKIKLKLEASLKLIEQKLEKIRHNIESKEKSALLAIEARIKIAIDNFRKKEDQLNDNFGQKFEESYDGFLNDVNHGSKKIAELIEIGHQRMTKLLHSCKNCGNIGHDTKPPSKTFIRHNKFL